MLWPEASLTSEGHHEKTSATHLCAVYKTRLKHAAAVAKAFTSPIPCTSMTKHKYTRLPAPSHAVRYLLLFPMYTHVVTSRVRTIPIRHFQSVTTPNCLTLYISSLPIFYLSLLLHLFTSLPGSISIYFSLLIAAQSADHISFFAFMFIMVAKQQVQRFKVR